MKIIDSDESGIMFDCIEKVLFAGFVQMRRRQLKMKCEDAARIAGLAVSQWYSLESGWIPDNDSNIWRSIAGTL
jgi:hypothetical protein